MATVSGFQGASHLTVNFNLHVALLVSANAFCTLCCAVHFVIAYLICFVVCLKRFPCSLEH